MAKLGWGGRALSVTDAEAGYQHRANRRVRKSDEELAQEKASFEQAEAAKGPHDDVDVRIVPSIVEPFEIVLAADELLGSVTEPRGSDLDVAWRWSGMTHRRAPVGGRWVS